MNVTIYNPEKTFISLNFLKAKEMQLKECIPFVVFILLRREDKSHEEGNIVECLKCAADTSNFCLRCMWYVHV